MLRRSALSKLRAGAQDGAGAMLGLVLLRRLGEIVGLVPAPLPLQARPPRAGTHQRNRRRPPEESARCSATG
jgi:hypothetical protein